MAEVLVPADDEVAVVAELNARMDAPAGTRIPLPRPPEFVRVVSAGGVERDLVSDTFTLAVEGFAATETAAQRLCAFAIAYLQSAGRSGILGGITCYGVGVTALPANLPMPSVPDRYRFTATITVSLRRASV